MPKNSGTIAVSMIDRVPYELKYMPRQPEGLTTHDGRRALAHMIVWGSGENDKFYDRTQIQRRVEELLKRISEGLEKGKYGD